MTPRGGALRLGYKRLPERGGHPESDGELVSFCRPRQGVVPRLWLPAVTWTAQRSAPAPLPLCPARRSAPSARRRWSLPCHTLDCAQQFLLWQVEVDRVG